MNELPATEQPSATQENTGISPMPAFSYNRINRCNLPAEILGSQTYQQHPVALTIDCVAELHADFFASIKAISCAEQRSIHFRQYMRSAFLLGQSEQAGYEPEQKNTGTKRSRSRDKIDYLRVLRGWMFNADSMEGAIIKRWVESRFGLLTLNHGGTLGSEQCVAHKKFLRDYANGLYNTNALEAQLDLVYSYCQYELQRQYSRRQHWRLYRGVNNIAKHTQIGERVNNCQHLLLNNLNSFSSDPHTAESFGDIILEIQVPSTKLLFFPELLNGVLEGEQEYLVIGGVYQAIFRR